MATEWIRPENSRERVNKAGEVLIGRDALPLDDALEVLNNWRSSHGFPLNTVSMDLRKKALRVNPNAVVGTRLKRAASIRRKLMRATSMKLSRMQDIGGCRAVMETATEVQEIVGQYDRSRAAHERIRVDDYIRSPQSSGYRAIHFVYRFRSKQKPEFENLSIEIQIRSKLQHAWSTAVETVGAMRREHLKGFEGDPRWLNFFFLASAAFASLEGTPFPPGAPRSSADLARRLADLTAELDVINQLLQFREALRIIRSPESGKADYFLLLRAPEESSLRIFGFRESELRRAAKEYLKQETQLSLFASESPEGGAVLVSASSIDQLGRAYPNYFSDTEFFLQKIREFIG